MADNSNQKMDKGVAEVRDDGSFSSILWDALVMIKNVIKALLISFISLFISPKRKCVNNQIVLITGSGGSLGRQLSLEFSKIGAVVVLWDINLVENEETAKQIRDVGGKCHTYICDVGNAAEVYRVGEKVMREVGDVDILVNNAGIVTGKGILDCPDEQIERTFNVNLLAHFWTVKCFLPAMLQKNSGHIVSISSSTGLDGIRNLIDYSASKFGVVGFTEVLNYEIVYSGYTGVHTTLVCPAVLNNKMFKGCQLRFPNVIKPTELDYCVDRIMEGILSNQNYVYIPRAVYFTVFLKTILPVNAHMEIQKFLGVANFMDNFQKKNNKADGNKPTESANGHGVLLTEEKKEA